MRKFKEWSHSKFDYSYNVLPDKYEDKGATSKPLYNPPHAMFILEGDRYVHNQMNFGNLLWAATGYTLGYQGFELKAGAHYNSLFGGRKNGYSMQFDSDDDQLSIRRGIHFAKKYGLRRKAIKRKPVIVNIPNDPIKW